jgi:serine/threonine protein kinase
MAHSNAAKETAHSPAPLSPNAMGTSSPPTVNVGGTGPQTSTGIENRPFSFFKRWLGRQESNTPSDTVHGVEEQRLGGTRRLSRRVIPGLPRPGTFKRQQSELRDRLEPHEPNADERRTVSLDRRRHVYVRDISNTTPQAQPRLSAPEVLERHEHIDTFLEAKNELTNTKIEEVPGYVQNPSYHNLPSLSIADYQSILSEPLDDELLKDLEKHWILNLSMHFRDKSQREKFFMTYAESPNYWRRVTISMDYRNAEQGSLEQDLVATRFQRDKSAKIYDAIRECLQDVQFYETVTNLKLKTEHGRLHIHVTEDVHEIVTYPHIRVINHLKCRHVREDALIFDSHLSGFVYKVVVDGQVYVKKEIPGPDTVDEFLYEINALHRLSGSKSVIKFGGVVMDNQGEFVKGLLIAFADQGALVDVLYDGQGQIPWARRERWAKDIVQGLAEIHDAGFVQGDFTLSNVVVDETDYAKIIDINRRGCPIGWEPPEILTLLDSQQRVSMYIGVKTDIFQLGMVLWAIATQKDEPERERRPLSLATQEKVPEYYRMIVDICLSDDPRSRCQASTLLAMFPEISDGERPIVKALEINEAIVVELEEDDSHSPGSLPAKYYSYMNGGDSVPPSEADTRPRGRSPLRRSSLTRSERDEQSKQLDGSQQPYKNAGQWAASQCPLEDEDITRSEQQGEHKGIGEQIQENGENIFTKQNTAATDLPPITETTQSSAMLAGVGAFTSADELWAVKEGLDSDDDLMSTGETNNDRLET